MIDKFRYTTILSPHGAGAIPALGFGTLIPDSGLTRETTKAALEAGFRHLDCAERYRNEAAGGDAVHDAVKAGPLTRKDLFVTTKLDPQSSPGAGQACVRGKLPA